jgi:hypothetical protein
MWSLTDGWQVILTGIDVFGQECVFGGGVTGASHKRLNPPAASWGQEFVLDCDHYPEAINWLAELLTLATP